jgi:cell division protein FtsX
METLLVKVSEHKKATMLVELLKSMDFIESVDLIGDMKSFKELFNKVNEEAALTDLKDMTMDDINKEIKEYRLEKKSDSN